MTCFMAQMKRESCASYFHFVQVGFFLLPAQMQVTFFFSGKSNIAGVPDMNDEKFIILIMMKSSSFL